MTTIATDGKTIAADGQRTWHGEIRGRNFKKIRASEGSVYAFSGTTPLMELAIEWHMKGADAENLPAGLAKAGEDGFWVLIVIDKKGIAKFSQTCPYIERFDPPIAFGAGQDYAIGAMLAGASPAKAVELVASLCNHTGGEIQVIDIAEALGLDKPLLEAAE